MTLLSFRGSRSENPEPTGKLAQAAIVSPGRRFRVRPVGPPRTDGAP